MHRAERRRLAVCLLTLTTATVCAQEIRLPGLDQPAPRAQRVSLATDSLALRPKQPAWVDIRFEVAPGFHINSHAPHDETLIPTALKLAPSPGLTVLTDAYPEGTPLHLNIGSGTTLSTYQGGFAVRLRLAAPTSGEFTLAGTLHYQACDAAACFPPRDLPVKLAVTVR